MRNKLSNPFPSSNSLKPRGVRGFALISSILIMALLVMIAMGMLSLSSIEVRASQNGRAMAEAQANARMALMIAIGELQKEMGPDQRVSITADQRSEDGGDGSVTSSAEGNRKWTGVFESWLATSEARPTPVFKSWLVSGDSNKLSLLDTAKTVLTGPDVIELVGEGTLGPDAKTGQVTVPVEDLTVNGVKKGRMAWWIGDQGVKAAVKTALPSSEQTFGVLRNNMQSAPRNAIEVVSTGTVKPFSGVEVDDPRLPRVTGWQQAAFLASDIAAPRPLFHDLAGSSTGLLTNVRSGGFRKDLSMKMESYTTAPDLSDPENVLYTAKSQMTGNDEVGINFMELWGYYHLYKELKNGGGLNYTTGGNISGDAAYLQTKNSKTAIANDMWDRFKHPITINYQTVYSFEVAPHPDEDGKNVLWLNFDPVVTLWNPLDVAVDIPKHDRWNYLYSFWMIPYDINIQINGGLERTCSISKTSNWKGDGNFLKLNAGVAETLTLKPGEVVKISQEGDTKSQNSRGQSIGGWEGFNGKKGFNYGGGARVPLLDSSSGGRGDEVYIVVSPSDTISYSATPSVRSEGGNARNFSLTQINLSLGGRGGIEHSYMSVDSRSGYTRVQVGEVRDRSAMYRMPNPVELKGDEHPEVYPKIEGPTMTRDLTAAALINDKATFMIHTYFAKTEEENLSESRMFSRFNPRAYSQNFYDLSKQERDMLPFETKIDGLTSWLDAPLDETISGQGFFGSSLGAQFGSNFVTTHSIPRQPIVSLAALQNSFANGFNMASKSGITESHSMSYPLLPQISHAIGNSLAPSVIPSDETTNNLSDYPHPLADHSYLANRELWDDYFFSGITPQEVRSFGETRDQVTVASEFFTGEKALPVARYLPDLGEKNETELLETFFSGGIPNDIGINNLASYLRVDGLFNVNSTSIEAWKAMLSSLKEREIVVRSESGVESIAPADSNTPVASLTAPRDVIIQDDGDMNPAQWDGRRTLTEAEIDGLARGIVKEVRKRGPFLSLADFVNRRVGTDKKLARAGAIQSALDSEDVEINKNQNTERSVNTAVAGRFAFPEAEEGAMNYGAPSIVKQGDILTPIAPVLSARSDSFIIRTYGEAVDSKGNVTARAWCEAVVERSRGYIDPADEPETITADLSKPVNQDFGRRFDIISFRWLNPREI